MDRTFRVGGVPKESWGQTNKECVYGLYRESLGHSGTDLETVSGLVYGQAKDHVTVEVVEDPDSTCPHVSSQGQVSDFKSETV